MTTRFESGEHPPLATLLEFRANTLGAEERATLSLHVEQCGLCSTQMVAPHGAQSEPTGEIAMPPLRPSAPAFKPGSVLGRYIILEVVGAGGMGEVYVAIDPELDRKVAIKVVIARSGSSEPNAQARLLREAQAMAKLAHPNVVGIYDVGTVEDRVFLAMELVRGRTLTEWLAERPRSWREVVDVFKAAGHGLIAAHAAGIVHRDFKPDNVLIGHDGRVHVSDFGLARADSGHEPELAPIEHAAAANLLSSPMTQPALVMGTLAFMAPELLKGRPASAASDQFAFAVSLYRALYRHAPFEAAAGEAPLQAVKEGRVRAEPNDRTVPAWLRSVMLRALRPDPSDRFASIGALLEALSKDPAVVWRKRLAAAGFVALTVALIAGSLGFVRHQNQRCTGAELKLQGIWDRQRQEAMREAFHATGLVYADDLWRGVQARLERYSNRWVEQRTATCEATALRGEQSESVLTLRMQCLDERLEELRSVTDLLLKADPTVVSAADRAPGALTDLSQCEDVVALERRMPVPKNAEIQQRVEAQRDSLRTAASLFALSQYREAKPLFESVAAEAASIGYPVLQAEATKWLIRVNGNLGALDKIRPLAMETIRLSEISGDELNRFEGTLALCELGDELAAPLPETLTYCELAGGILPRIKEAHEPRARLENSLGNIYVTRNRYDESLAAYRRGLKALKAHPESGYYEELLLENCAYVLSAQNKPREALEQELQSLANTLKRLGPKSADTGHSFATISGSYLQLNDLPNALKAIEEAVPVTRAALGPEHPLVGDALRIKGQILNELGRRSEAALTLQEAVSILERDKHSYLPAALESLAETMRRDGRPADALPLFERAHARYLENSVVPPDHALLGEARSLFDLKRFTAAEPKLEAIVAALEAAAFQDHVFLFEARFELAKTRAALARDRAVTDALVSRAIADLDQVEGDTAERRAALNRLRAAPPVDARRR